MVRKRVPLGGIGKTASSCILNLRKAFVGEQDIVRTSVHRVVEVHEVQEELTRSGSV